MQPALSLPTWPVFEQDEIDAVSKVLASGKVNYWTGTKGKEFEQAWAEKIGTKHAIAIANGTVTLELALIALGIGPGDDVILTPRTFVATATAIMVRGARPVFADIDPESGNITAESIERVLTPRTKAVIPVHIGGWPCELDPMLELGVPIIEDCAQAHGAKYKGRSVGSFGLINSWSFCQDKIMTLGGEGGAITCDDYDLWKRMWEYKDHGKSYDTYYGPHAPGFRWVNEGIGTNWRLTEMQSAIAIEQTRKLDRWVEARRRNGHVLVDRLKDHPMLAVPVAPSHMANAFYRWYGYLDLDALKSDWTRERVCDEVAKRGVWCQVGSCCEIYREKTFDGTDSRPEKPLPHAARMGATSVSMKTDPNLTVEHMHCMADQLEGVLAEAKR